MPPPRYALTFDSPSAAHQFVQALILAMRHLAVYRDGCDVTVLDGGDLEQAFERRDALYALALEHHALNVNAGDTIV